MADPEALDRLSDAVIDGVAVDWEGIQALTPNEADRAVVEQLRVIAAIAAINRTADISPSVADLVPTEAITPPAGAVRWGPLLILGELAEGSFGRVYRALDPRLQREVALKLLRTSASSTSPDQIVSEARLLARVRHENVVTVYGADVVNGEVGLWMELIHGRRLDALVAAEGPLDAEDATRIGTALCQALAAVHQAGLLHRDIKAQNVMREAGGRVVLMDFGAGRDLFDEAAHPVGTPVYLAPEVLAGEPASIQSDIYSVGVLLFFLTTGRYPAIATSLDELRGLHARGAVAPLHDLRPDLPLEFVDVVTRALAPDPTARYQSAESFERELRRLAEAGETGRENQPTPLPIVRRVALLGTLLMAAALAVTAERGCWPWRSAAPAGPFVLAILPPSNPTADPVAEQVGTAVASLVSGNFRKLSGLKVVSREGTAAYAAVPADIERLKKDVGASFVADVTVRRTAPTIDVVARLWRPDASVPVWNRPLTGDLVAVQQQLLQELARALEAQGLGAIDAGERAALLKLPTTHADAYLAYVQGRALLDRAEESGNLARAIDVFERAIGIDSRFALAHMALADAFRERSTVERDRKLLEPAARAATTAVQLDPDSGAARTALAAVQNDLGKRDEAVSALRQAIALQPDYDEARRLLGRILAAQGHVDEGVAELQAAIRQRPTSFQHYSSLGYVLLNASRYRAAADAYEKAAEMRPNNAASYEMLGAIYQLQGDSNRAIGHYEHAIRLGPSSVAHANLALAYFTAGEYAKARDALIAAIERDPKKASLHRDLGDVYLRLNRRGDARPAYERAIALSEATLATTPHDPFPIVLIALCEANLGRRSAAERHATEAMALLPENRDVLFRSAKVFALTGNRTAALKALRSAIERGYDREVARRDPELASLKTMPEFTSALSAVSATQKRGGR